MRPKAEGGPHSTQVTRPPVGLLSGGRMQRVESPDHLLCECRHYQECMLKATCQKAVFMSNNWFP